MDDSTTAEEKSFGIIAQHGGNHSVFMHKTPPFKGNGIKLTDMSSML